MTAFSIGSRTESKQKFALGAEVDFTFDHKESHKKIVDRWHVTHVTFIFSRTKRPDEAWSSWTLSGSCRGRRVKKDGTDGEIGLDRYVGSLAAYFKTDATELQPHWQPHLADLLAEAIQVRDTTASDAV